MKKLIGVFLFTLLSSPAWAGVNCTLPFNFTPGSTADANQVMANYNALVTCLSNAASAGINNDITALTGITTPLSPTSGGTTVFVGSPATGTANAVVLTTTTPNSFTRTTNYCVTFVPSASNTGATTLAVGSTPATNLFKPTQTGPVALTGGELASGQILGACFDGTQYVLRTQATTGSLNLINQVVSGGATVNAAVNGNLGTIAAGGSVNVNCGLSPLQYFVNNGNFTLAAPTNDSSCLIMMTNGATAGTPTYSGFIVGANVGDSTDSTPGHKFIYTVIRVNGTPTYFVKALQ